MATSTSKLTTKYQATIAAPVRKILKLELAGHPDLKQAIVDCETIGDFVSRDLFQSIIESEEEHIDWLETQLALIDKVGIQNYQQAYMS